MPLKDFLKGFHYDPATFKPDEFKAALEREYDADESAWSAKLTTETAKNEGFEKTITEQKTQLWDYYMKSGTPILKDNASGSHVGPLDGEDPEGYQAKGLGSFFGDTEKTE